MIVENLPIIIVIAIMLLNIRTIVGFISMLQYEFKIPKFHTIEREDIAPSVESIIQPCESFLLSKGFIYQHALVFDNPQIGLELENHIYYYFHPIEILLVRLPTKAHSREQLYHTLHSMRAKR